MELGRWLEAITVSQTKDDGDLDKAYIHRCSESCLLSGYIDMMHSEMSITTNNPVYLEIVK